MLLRFRKRKLGEGKTSQENKAISVINKNLFKYTLKDKNHFG